MMMNNYRLPYRNYRNTNLPEKMTSEMWEVYRLIEENTKNGRYTTIDEICEKIEYYHIEQ